MRRGWFQVLVLTGVWLLLWGDISGWLVIGGLLTSWLVVAVFPFPRAPWVATIRPWSFLMLLARFGVDVVRASIEVAWIAVRPAPPPASAVLRVDLRTRSELLMTTTGGLVSLVPGSLLIELTPETSAMYVHVLDGSTPEAIERARRNVLAQEERVVRALAPRVERDAICGKGNP
ncbi:Na+/H+ antiporter subunit E [Aeromicrobium sp. CTD01-1L150]|uniref:Na+/H+ antiporter subunit E n=1 Tax=Aeromicrobium sp. CTD01-1L150 TaxID=3341830 RepID=UPI0035BF2BE5